MQIGKRTEIAGDDEAILFLVYGLKKVTRQTINIKQKVRFENLRDQLDLTINKKNESNVKL